MKFRKKPPSGKSVDTEAVELINLSSDAQHITINESQHLSRPQQLRNKDYIWKLSICMDFILILLPYGFIILAGVAMSLNNHPASADGERVKSVTLLSPTIFPIMYAAIVGKFLRRISLYKAERGIALGILERLIGSQSLFTAIERQVGLRKFDLLAVFLTILWLLSPLGGQASLRLLTTEPLIDYFEQDIRYFPIEGFSRSSIMTVNDREAMLIAHVPLYLTCLRAARGNMNRSTDLWGEVKIPDVSFGSLVGPPDDWTSVGNDDITYTSLLGIPVAGIPTHGNLSFSIMSAYWAVNCGNFTAANSPTKNSSEYSQNPAKTFEMQLFNPWLNEAEFNFTYTTHKDEYNISKSECKAKPTFVESHVNCAARNCRVDAIRSVAREGNPFGRSTLRHVLRHILNFLPGSGVEMVHADNTTNDRSEFTEQWLMNPETTFSGRQISITVQDPSGSSDIYKLPGQSGFVDLSTLPSDVFSKRLQMALNTFWESTAGGEYRIGNLTLDMNFNLCEGCDLPDGQFPIFNTTRLYGQRFDGKIFVCRKWFAFLTIGISWILFMLASMSVVLRYVTIAPDILGYVSTFMRDNPHIDIKLPSHLDGMERARELQTLYVMIGDVKPELEVGQVAFAAMKIGPKRLSTRRLYD